MGGAFQPWAGPGRAGLSGENKMGTPNPAKSIEIYGNPCKIRQNGNFGGDKNSKYNDKGIEIKIITKLKIT